MKALEHGIIKGNIGIKRKENSKVKWKSIWQNAKQMTSDTKMRNCIIE